MKSLPKKILFGVIFFLLIATPAQALVSVGQQGFEEAISSKQYNKESFDFQSLSGLVSSANTLILGCQVDSCPDNLKAGALHQTTFMIAGLYANPPISGIAYVHDTIRNFGIGPTVYAQEPGFGFRALSPVLEVWKIFRNVSYSLIVIALVFIGFAIMFRYKIGPQTIITIQSAIPRIVVALLLITFSYAIAGFLVDFLYLFIAVFMAVMSPVINDSSQAQRYLLDANFGAIVTSYLSPAEGLGVANRVASEFFSSGVLGAISGAATGSIIGGIVGFIFGGAVGAGLGAAGGGVLGGLGGATVGGGHFLVTVILAILLLFSLFRLFILLLTSYIQIVLSVIFAPLIILIDVIPGRSGFGLWFRGLLANIIVFPLTIVLLVIGLSLGGSITRTQVAWSPPPLGVGSVEAAVALLLYGLLLILPQILSQVKGLITGRPTFDIGAAIREGTAPLRAAGGMVTGRIR